jgi:hypothetical protein
MAEKRKKKVEDEPGSDNLEDDADLLNMDQNN